MPRRSAESRKRSRAARKGWETRRARAEARSRAARKGWQTRRARERAEARHVAPTPIAAPWFTKAGQKQLRYEREERAAIRHERAATPEDFQDIAIADLRDLQAHAPAAVKPGHPGKSQELDEWARDFWEAFGEDYDFDLHDAYDMAYGYLDTPF